VTARACRNRASASRLVTPRSCMRPMASCTRSVPRGWGATKRRIASCWTLGRVLPLCRNGSSGSV
jgi:hypothetical protein